MPTLLERIVKKIILCIHRRTNPAQPSCAARGSLEIAEQLEREIAMHGWDIKLERFDCLGRCDEGPNLRLAPGGPFRSGIVASHLEELLREIERFSRTDNS